jgi:transcriptional regulator with XRE-family HTH domain
MEKVKINFDQLREDVEIYLKQNRLLQSDFAERAGITTTTLSRFLTKHRTAPDMVNVVKMARALNKSVAYYVDGDARIVYYPNDSTPDKIKAVIYADKTLTPSIKEALSEMMRVGYEDLVKI